MMSTHSITGKFTGNFDIVVRPTAGDEAGKTQSFSGLADDPVGYGTWTWDFDAGTVTLQDGRLTRSIQDTDSSADYFDYEARKQGDLESVELTLEVDPVDSNFYFVHYDWKIQPGIAGDSSEAEEASIKLEITKLKDGSIAIVTALGANGIPGSPLLPSTDFPNGLAPDWRGRAIPD